MINKKAVNMTVERLIFIILTILVAAIVFFAISKMAPGLFDSVKDLF